jgi:purine-binding chemotaxis protein CheW
VKVLAFDVGGLACAVGLSQVREVLEPRPVTLVPGAPAAAPAVFALRGRIVTVIDLALRLGVAPSRRRPEWLVVEGPADVGVCALETEGVIGLSSVDPASLARPRGLAAAEDLLSGVTLQPEGPLLVLDLDRILDAEAVRRTRASRSRSQRPALPAPVARGRSAPVVPSSGWNPSPPLRDPPLLTITPAPALPVGGVSARSASPRPAALGSLPAARPPATRAPGASLARAGGGPRQDASPLHVPAAPPGPRACASARNDEGHGPDQDVGRREAIHSTHRSHAGVLAASAVAAVAFVALLGRWSAPPRVAPDARAVAPAPIHRSIERGVVDSSVPAASERLAPLYAPGPSPPQPIAVLRTAPPASFVVVARGDSLWRLAGVHLGAPSAWPRLHDLNRGAITDPDRIVPGQRLALPAEGR